MASSPLKVTDGKVAGSPPAHVKDSKVQYLFTGFRQDSDTRIFHYEDTGKEHSGFKYAVSVDLALARLYGIQTQELPLMCRVMLERRDDQALAETLTFTENEMRLHATHLCDVRRAATLRKKSRFRPPAVVNRVGWRAPQQVLPA